MLLKKLFPLLLTLLLFCGCGGSSSEVLVVPSGSTPALDSSLELRLASQQIPAGVDEVRALGLNADGKEIWEVSSPPGDTLSCRQLPEGTAEVVVQYLANQRLAALSFVPLADPASQVRGRSVSAPEVLSLDQAITSVALSNTDVEMSSDTVVLLELQATLANGKTLELGREASWTSEFLGYARVTDGLVLAGNPSQSRSTTITASLGSHSASTSVTVSPPASRLPSLVLTLKQGDTLDLEEGTLNARPLQGWNAKNRCFEVENFVLVAGSPTQLVPLFSLLGDENNLVVNASNSLNVLGALTPSGRVLSSYFAVAGNSFSTTEIEALSTGGDIGQRGGDLTIITGNGLSAGALLTYGNGPGRRGGNLRVASLGDVECQYAITGAGLLRPQRASNAVAGRPGDVFLAGSSVSLGAGPLEYPLPYTGILASSVNLGGRGPGPAGGRVTVVAGPGGIAFAEGSGIEASGSAGAATAGSSYGRGGDGGEVTLVTDGAITGTAKLLAAGGKAFGSSVGGAGGTIRVYTPDAVSGGTADASGGSSEAGPGGAGGQVALTAQGLAFDVSGGAGNPPGAEGGAATLGSALTVDGEHHFDMSTGLYDGDSTLPGWDPISQTLTVSSLTISEGGSLNIEGSGLFTCVSDQAVSISGLLGFAGLDASSNAEATAGGAMSVQSSDAIVVGETGAVLSQGGGSVGVAGNGGSISLSAASLQVAGRIAALGGESSSQRSGNGGSIDVNAETVTLSGALDSSGQTGFNAAGAGGSISVTTTGDFIATGSLRCAGGDTAISGAPGGQVLLDIGGNAGLMTVDCNGSDSGLGVGDGGQIKLSTVGDLMTNGLVTANSGTSSGGREGNGGTVTLSGQTVTVSATSSVEANGTRRGKGGSVTITGVLAVVRDGIVAATPGGTVQVSP